MKNTLKKNVPRIQELKKEAHDLIDAIVRTGISKNSVYYLLRERLGCIEGKQHFFNMYTERDVRKAREALETMLSERVSLLRERKEAKRAADRERRAGANPAPVATTKGGYLAATREPSKKHLTRKASTLPLSEQKAALAALRQTKKKSFIRTLIDTLLWKN
jgi:hypothetical protein